MTGIEPVADRLPHAQRQALAAAGFYPLVCCNAGWRMNSQGETINPRYYSTRTLDALKAKGLLRFVDVKDGDAYVRRGRYEVSEFGRDAIRYLELHK